MARRGRDKRDGDTSTTKKRGRSKHAPKTGERADKRAAERGADREGDRDAAAPAPPPADLLRRSARARPSRAATQIAGLVVDLFGRRFTLEADGARTLVDLGRDGAALARIAPGTRLTAFGRMRDGEFKAWIVQAPQEAPLVLRKRKKARRIAAALTPSAEAAPTPAPVEPPPAV